MIILKSFLSSISNHIWYMENGIFNIPFFNPHKTGGNFSFAHPIDVSTTLSQYLLFFTDPLTSVALCFFIFAFIGFTGSYFLLKKVFRYDTWVCLTGASLFLFNGFYTYKVIVAGILIIIASCFFPGFYYFYFTTLNIKLVDRRSFMNLFLSVWLLFYFLTQSI